MGLKIHFDLFANKPDVLRNILRPWRARSTGGVFLVVAFTSLFCTICTIKTNNTLKTKSRDLVNTTEEFSELERLLSMENNYQSALSDHLKTEEIGHFLRFSAPTNIDQLKDHFKKWQASLKIKSIDFDIGESMPYPHGKGIVTLPIKISTVVNSDRTVYQLIEKIQDQIPGALIIQNIECKRLQNSTVGKNNTANAKNSPQVEASIMGNWYYILKQD